MGTISNCDYHYSTMQFVHAKKYSESSPCTNIPIRCGLCKDTPTTIWKYNAISHLAIEHQFLEDSAISPPSSMWIDMRITRQEEVKFRVPQDVTDRYRLANEIPDSDWYTDDIIQQIREGIEDRDETEQELVNRTEKHKRSRGESASTTHSTVPPAKISRH